MASEGFDAATVARVVEESGVPLSSVYHYYGSKDGVLLAVMERGAERFFADVPELYERVGTAAEHLRTVVANAAEALERHPNFLRLLIVFAVQPPNAGGGEVAAVVRQVRNTALKRLRGQLALAFGADPRSHVTTSSPGSLWQRSTVRSSPPGPTPARPSGEYSSPFRTHSSPHDAHSDSATPAHRTQARADGWRSGWAGCQPPEPWVLSGSCHR